MFDAFYSDPHYGHAKIIQHCTRPFEDVDHMHRELVGRYNETVGRNERVLWTGDAFFSRFEDMKKTLGELHGEKWLVRGNHDKHSDQQYLRAGFAAVMPEVFFMLGVHVCHASHYPYRKDGRTGDERYLERMPPMRDGMFLLHGHTHSKERSTAGAVHVGVDAWDYRPARRAEVGEILNGFVRRGKTLPDPV